MDTGNTAKVTSCSAKDTGNAAKVTNCSATDTHNAAKVTTFSAKDTLMRKRQEFDRATRAEILRLAQRPTGFQCALCGLIVTKGDADHIIAQALYVEKRKLTAADGQFACRDCHKAKTALEDVPRIAKAKRQEAAELGICSRPAQPIKSRGFEKRERPSKIGQAKIEKQPVARREIYE